MKVALVQSVRHAVFQGDSGGAALGDRLETVRVVNR